MRHIFASGREQLRHARHARLNASRRHREWSFLSIWSPKRQAGLFYSSSAAQFRRPPHSRQRSIHSCVPYNRRSRDSNILLRVAPHLPQRFRALVQSKLVVEHSNLSVLCLEKKALSLGLGRITLRNGRLQLRL